MTALTSAVPSASTATDLLALFAENGYRRAEPDLLQPSDLFLDLSGEDIRRRLYLTQDADGREFCLRPEFTIPVARLYLASSAVPAIAEYAYQGKVFRQRSQESGEFVQAGVESFGRTDREAADAQVFALALAAATRMGSDRPRARLGDVALLGSLLDQLAIDPPLQRRLLRGLAAGKPASSLLLSKGEDASADQGLAAYTGVMTALRNAEPGEAKAFVKDLLSIAGISTVGGRSAADIAERFLSQAGRNGATLSQEATRVIEAFLALDGDPDEVSAELRALAKEAGLDFGPTLAAYEQRIGFMAAEGVDLSQISMQTRFVRNLDYYTSFVFEIDGTAPGKPAVGGGRYDRLLARLGAPGDVPAVGFAVWPERFAGDGA